MRKNPYKGTFVAFEGIEGSGKSTQCKKFTKTLQEKIGSCVFHTVEPTKISTFGRLARFLLTSPPEALARHLATADIQILVNLSDKTQRWYDRFKTMAQNIGNGDLSALPLFFQLCMIFDRWRHREQEHVLLSGGTPVVSDRDLLSTFAYGAADELDSQELLQAHEDILGPLFFLPDIFVFLRVSPDVGLARTAAKQGTAKERHDNHTFQTRVAKEYENIVSNPAITRHCTIISIDGSPNDQDNIAEIIWSRVEPLLKK